MKGGRVKLFINRKVVLSLVGSGNWSRCKKSQKKKRIQSAQLFILFLEKFKKLF